MYVTGLGGATYDLHIRCDGPVLLGDSNPSTTKSSPGGVMRNILDNLARLGTECKFISRVGNDAYGDVLLDSLERLEIDASGVKRTSDFATALYIDFLAPDGDMFVAANDMKIIDNLPGSQLDEMSEQIKGSEALIMDANLSPETMAHFVEISGDIPIFFDAVSFSKVRRVLGVIDKIFLIKPNAMELSALTDMTCGTKEEVAKATDKLLSMGVKNVCVTLGKEGCYFKENGKEGFFAKLAPVEIMGNATGAGDAFTAGLVHGYLKGLSNEKMVDFALACGKLAVKSELTINPDMSEANVLKELE